MAREGGGLRPIGDSIKKIIKKLEDERKRRRGNKSIRVQPKLPGLKKGGLSDYYKDIL
jgi:hypothetical protein|tara:strand:+ start:1242 stop:1415 length:174 start_codon:yes stop_codon:yes gene_type:complete